MSEADPTKFLRAAGRAALAPLGISLLGRGRNWVDDHGWWIVNIEFQPSGWSKGSYLNVGVQWLWKPFPAHAFEYGDRVPLRYRGKSVEFIEFGDDTQFRDAAQQLATTAAREVLKYRELFATLEATIEVLRKAGPLYRYDLAVAYGLIGRDQEASRLFAAAAVKDAPRDWEIERNELMDQLGTLARDTPAFRARVLEIVIGQRRVLKLNDRVVKLPNRI